MRNRNHNVLTNQLRLDYNCNYLSLGTNVLSLHGRLFCRALDGFFRLHQSEGLGNIHLHTQAICRATATVLLVAPIIVVGVRTSV
jgi:hypothetical protein